MAVGDCERSVGSSAAEHGVELVPTPRFSWLNTRGHFALPTEAQGVVPALQEAFARLGGDPAELLAKQLRTLPNDLFHERTKTMVEVDEFQHFTSMRALTLNYLGGTFTDRALSEYTDLCETWSPQADKYRRSKTAGGFPGENGRQRQRAYNDLLRDLVAPLMGFRVIRVPAPKMTGLEAFEASRGALLDALT